MYQPPMKRENRSNIAAAVFGFKETGKSTWLNSEAVKYNQKTGKRVLIINVNGSPAYDAHQILTYENFPRWKRGVKQFYDPDTDVMWDFLIDLYHKDNQFNGMIIFEDCWKYIDPNPSKRIRTFLTDHRMINADLYYSFHSFDFMPPRFWKMTTHIVIKKTSDILEENVRENRKKIPNFDAVLKTYLQVKNAKNIFTTKIVETGI